MKNEDIKKAVDAIVENAFQAAMREYAELMHRYALGHIKDWFIHVPTRLIK